MYVSDKKVAEQLLNQLEFESQYYSNLRWNYTDEHWDKVKYLFNLTNFKERILHSNNIIGDIIIDIKYSHLLQYWDSAKNFIENIHSIVDQNEVGSYDGGFCTMHIHSKNNIMSNYIKCKNIDLILNDKEFNFI